MARGWCYHAAAGAGAGGGAAAAGAGVQGLRAARGLRVRAGTAGRQRVVHALAPMMHALLLIAGVCSSAR